MTNEEYAMFLEAMAQKYRENPTLERGSVNDYGTYIWCATKEKFVETIRAFGAGKKEVDGVSFKFVASVGGVAVNVMTSRENVCTRKVVGTKWVEEKREETITPAHEEEMVEWECPDSLLQTSGETDGETA